MTGYRQVKFTPHRQVVYDMLSRARRFHAPVTGCIEVDMTEARSRIRQERRAGRRLGLVAYLTRATALTIQRHDSLQRHLFTTWYGRPKEVVFDAIDCTLIVARRGPQGEEFLLPVLLRQVDTLTVDEIHATVQRYRTQRLDSLEEMQAFERIKRAPRVALSWFSYKARSDPAFYQRYFGTYGLSSMMDVGGSGNSLATVANTAVAFLPGTLKERPWVVQGQVVPRSILNLAMVFDHYLVDGAEGLRVARTLSQLLEHPDMILGPAAETEDVR